MNLHCLCIYVFVFVFAKFKTGAVFAVTRRCQMNLNCLGSPHLKSFTAKQWTAARDCWYIKQYSFLEILQLKSTNSGLVKPTIFQRAYYSRGIFPHILGFFLRQPSWKLKFWVVTVWFILFYSLSNFSLVAKFEEQKIKVTDIGWMGGGYKFCSQNTSVFLRGASPSNCAQLWMKI